jgi:two-component sensor histidine kinase
MLFDWVGFQGQSSMVLRAHRLATPRWIRDLLLQSPGFWKGQAIAVLCTGLAVLLRLALSPVASRGVPFLSFFPSIFVATAVAGPWAGVTATILAVPIAVYFWLPPAGSFALDHESWLRLIGFCTLSGLLVLSLTLLRVLVRTLVDSEVRALILAHEMTHRARNVLGLIQAISRQTFQSATSLQEFQNLFEARLVALGRAQDLIIENPNFPTDLRILLDRVLEPFETDRFRIKGEAAGVPHEIGATLALLIHELATNSLKYGALSVPEGTVAVTWFKEGESVALDWEEHDGPKVLPPSRSGFGTRLMQTAFAPGRGEATIAFEESGVRCRICFPRAAG